MNDFSLLQQWLTTHSQHPFPRAQHFDFFDGNATAYIRVGKRFNPHTQILGLTVTLATIDVIQQRQGHMHQIMNTLEQWAQEHQAMMCVESVLNPDLRRSLHKMEYQDSPLDELECGDMWKICDIVL